MKKASLIMEHARDGGVGSERDGDPQAPHKSSKFSPSSLVNAKKSLGEKESSSLAERSSSHLVGASSPPTTSPVGHHAGELFFCFVFISSEFPQKKSLSRHVGVCRLHSETKGKIRCVFFARCRTSNWQALCNHAA